MVIVRIRNTIIERRDKKKSDGMLAFCHYLLFLCCSLCIPKREISLVSKTIFSLIALLSVSIFVSPGPLNPHPLSPSPPDAFGPIINEQIMRKESKHMIWYDAALYDMIWCCMIWYDVVLFKMMYDRREQDITKESMTQGKTGQEKVGYDKTRQ